ncbi:MAG: DUF362 domain-containing protein [Candidatus Aminicenantes bacterium]|nr:DUF362 domain-containing protein [Candidatus Aminicenantes bacterium]
MRLRRVFELRSEEGPTGAEDMTRRTFVGLAVSGMAALPSLGRLRGSANPSPPPSQVNVTSAIRTNIEDIRKIPRTPLSMPGKYPGRVVKVLTGNAAAGGKIDLAKTRRSLDRGLMELTGRSTARDAWREFVSPDDRVGIKVNPIAPRLPTSLELTRAVIDSLREAGVPLANIAVWDRRQVDLEGAGYDKLSRDPGVAVLSTEVKGANGDFYDAQGELWSLANIDREAPAYFAEIEGSYDRDDLPYMVNGGKWSYFSKLVTQRFTKIINLPILKTCQPVGISFAMKNLAYGSLSNTSRLHAVGVNAIGEACAFPCLRDKAVLQIGDALRASYYGGLGANPKYTWDANLLLIGTDPVAVDLATLDFVTGVRIARGVQLTEDPKNRIYLDIAAGLGLGVADRSKLDLREAAVPPD